MKQMGKVWLAGAGPGDAGLLTMKTRDLMDQADVVVYDALISVEILSLIPVGTERINVGKRSGLHTVPQEEINQILLNCARQGKNVLRLKGGDPFVFGRGGEELELLVKEGIPYEIIPGITSVTAVPAYAGIPLTHRDYASSFHVITGHPGKGKGSDIKYKALVEMEATLVFLMGITAMDSICKNLIAAGMAKDTPAAVLEKGTTARQRSVISTVEHLVQEAEKVRIETPAIIIVGKVCSLAEAFQWTDCRPLNGRQILITRPKQLVSGLAGKLRGQGAQVIELPSIITETITNNEVMKNELLQIRDWEEVWLVFTSAIGVDLFFEQLAALRLDIRTLLQNLTVRFGVIGAATGKALGKYGIFADLMPEAYNAKALGEELAKTIGTAKVWDRTRVICLRAEDGSPFLLPPLKEKDISYVDVPLYKTICRADVELRGKIMEMLNQKEIDWVTFTSASTVKGFVSTFGDIDYRKVRAICIGEQTAMEALTYGMQVTVSKLATVDSMVECMLGQG